MLNRTTTTYDSLGPGIKRSHLKAQQLAGTKIVGAPQKATLTKFTGAPLLKWLAAFCVLDNVLGAATLPSSPPPKFDADAVLDPSCNTVCSPHVLATLGPSLIDR